MNNKNTKLSQNTDQLSKNIESEINFKELLHKYGSEGLYIIANKLTELANINSLDNT